MPTTATRSERLEDIVYELVDLYQEWAVCWEVERRARASAYSQAFQSSMGATASDQWSLVSSADAAVETTKVTQKLKALEAERDYLLFAITHNL